MFSSDLSRAAETASIAFGGSAIPVLYDWRLRECDYGQCNGMPATELHASRPDYVDRPYPGGESWRQAVARVTRSWVTCRCARAGCGVLVDRPRALTRWGLDHVIGGAAVEDLAVADFAWQEGWEYRLG